MDPDEKRIQILTRLGKEKVIKNGTYDMDKAKSIIQDHPFYKKPEEENASETNADASDMCDEQEPISDEDAEVLAAQIMQNNFKTGMSQADVDAFLSGMI